MWHMPRRKQASKGRAKRIVFSSAPKSWKRPRLPKGDACTETPAAISPPFACVPSPRLTSCNSGEDKELKEPVFLKPLDLDKDQDDVDIKVSQLFQDLFYQSLAVEFCRSETGGLTYRPAHGLPLSSTEIFGNAEAMGPINQAV